MKGLRSEDLIAIVDFLYHGEANIFQENLDSFLALAEELRLRGLTGGAEAEKEPVKEPPYSKSVPLKEEIGQIIQTLPNLESPPPTGSQNTTVALTNHKVNVELKDLDEQIKSMITKSDARTSNGQGSMASCNVCGKQGPLKHMPHHIEAFHISGVSHPCDICGKVSRSRHGLSMHKVQVHDQRKRKVLAGPERL